MEKPLASQPNTILNSRSPESMDLIIAARDRRLSHVTPEIGKSPEFANALLASIIADVHRSELPRPSFTFGVGKDPKADNTTRRAATEIGQLVNALGLPEEVHIVIDFASGTVYETTGPGNTPQTPFYQRRAQEPELVDITP